VSPSRAGHSRARSRARPTRVVSGTAIDTVFIRRLQDNGIDSSLRAVLDRFLWETSSRRSSNVLPSAATNERALPRHPHAHPSHPQKSIDLLVLAAFVEVALAKEGHEGPVGINLLTKIQVPTAPTLLGAMLAGVDYVMMGAACDAHPGHARRARTRQRRRGSVRPGGPNDVRAILHFDPSRYLASATLRRPRFIASCPHTVLATALAKT